MIHNLFKNIVFILIVLKIPAFGIAQDFEVSPGIMKFTAEPGESKTMALTIINHANVDQDFNIIVKDFMFNKEGALVQMPEGSTEHSLAKWISINPPHVKLVPNETKQIIVSIQAPADDYTTRWASLLIRSVSEQTAALADKKVQTGLMVAGQIVIQVYQSPKSNINYKMKITGITEITTGQDSIRRFKALVDNIGDKITNCKVTLLANNLSTAEETVIQTINFKMLPDGQREIILKMPKDALPPGKYALAAILDYGKQSNLEGTQMVITVN
ncbi:MAG: DUF916 domain-containing protein [Bacteroidales bacterium]|nr:DUF916 domain-containing protein [Bacteroidales bacterium]